MAAVYMERSDYTLNLARFYQVEIQPTLFGDWAVICRWGRIGAYGSMQQDWFGSLPEAQAAQARSIARKRRPGYVH
jgi:predicted DNA-binding WGR domain protein